MKLKYFFVLILLQFSISFSNITVTPEKYDLTIGEKFSVNYEITYPESALIDISILQNYSKEDLEHLSFKQTLKKVIDGIIIENYSSEYMIFADTGKYYFEPIRFSYVKGEKTYEYFTDSLEFKIHSNLNGSVNYTDSLGNLQTLPLDSLKMVLPIKDIDEYKLTSTEKKYIVSFISFVIIIILLIYFFLKKKKNRLPEEQQIKKIIIPAHIKALKRLNELKDKKYLQRGDYKEFASELSLIIRLFLEDRYQFPGAEIPTEDLKIEIEKYISDNNQLEKIYKLLEVTDFVKFAKFIPLEEELNNFLDFAFDLVNELKEEKEIDV